jgi:hypothetical protein
LSDEIAVENLRDEFRRHADEIVIGSEALHRIGHRDRV